MYRLHRAEPDLAGEINTTPLIDVLLVLLVMLIITIPAQTHAVKFDLPIPTPIPLPPPNTTSNLLVVQANGSLLWNGAPIGRDGLQHELALVRQMSPTPEVHIQPNADARHGDVDAALAIVKREQISTVGFVGNEKYLNVF